MKGERAVWVLSIAIAAAMLGVVAAVFLLAALISPVR